MLTRETMKGIYVIAPTPFTERGRLDEGALRHNVERLKAVGAAALVSCGSSGEFFTISDADHRRLAEVVSEEAGSELVNVVGCSAVNTELQLERTRAAKESGAEAVMNLVPFYGSLTWEETRTFWHELAEGAPGVGIIVYNFAGGRKHSFEELKQLAKEIPAICGTKEGHYDWDLWLRLLRETDLAALSATDKTWWVACRRMGGKGMMSMAASAFPTLVKALDEACLAGKWEEAEGLERKLQEIYRFIEGREYLKGWGGIARFKALVNAAGWLVCGKCKRPLLSVPEEVEGQLRADLKARYGEWVAPD